MNVVAWLEFKLAYYNIAVQHVSHYATGTALRFYKDLKQSEECVRI